MKKEFNKRLDLKKTTISNLLDDEMREIKGATFIVGTCVCDTASCSIEVQCCDPPPEKMAMAFYLPQ